jgi:xanthine dehydrogenase molybdenum-binding subunit
MGGALTEKFIIENGVIFTDRMARYRIPTMTQTPEISSIIVEHPTREGPYGAKGVGEIAGIPTAPAIANAIFNAVGVRVYYLPIDHEFIWKSLDK